VRRLRPNRGAIVERTIREVKQAGVIERTELGLDPGKRLLHRFLGRRVVAEHHEGQPNHRAVLALEQGLEGDLAGGVALNAH
jgi:hypothetical protein